MGGDQLQQYLANQARFARAGDAGYGSQARCRERHVDATQIVAMYTLQRQPTLSSIFGVEGAPFAA